MALIDRPVKTVSGKTLKDLDYQALLAAGEPILFKGMARDWPLVQKALQSPQAAVDYLNSFYTKKPIVVYRGDETVKGRVFYNDTMTGFNFKPAQDQLPVVLDEVLSHIDNPNPPTVYVGSTDLDIFFSGIRAENDIPLDDPMFAQSPPLVSAWIGNRTIATAHFDMSHNVAVCAAGHRRFTLFPPEQVENLYPGPLEPTPGGQVVSLVDFRNPDYEAFPKFKNAVAAGQVAEMEPGDLLFFPAMWWHHVEALDGFNILINYWWNTVPAFVDTPWNTINHAILSLRDRSEAEKAAWKALFDYYIFGNPETPRAHIPPLAQGALGPLDQNTARRLRAMLLSKFNR